MRQIKFRGLRTDGKGFVIGYLVDWRSVNGDCEIMDLSHAYEVIPESVGQYTGLTDKNGVEIYEGDVILFDGIEGVISFSDALFQVSFEYTRSIHALGELDREIEITGNIHEKS